MNTGFTIEAIMTRASSMVDGGLSLGFHTKELSAQEKVEVMKFHNQGGHLLFNADEIASSSIPAQPSSMGLKTPSQRLRAVLYILFTQKKTDENFEDFYKEKMEVLIDAVKKQLDPQ